jgi:subtilisin-like proprotein convertase family protein
VTNQTSCTTGTTNVNEKIGFFDNGANKGTSKEFTLTTAAFSTASSQRQPLEGVEVDLNFTHTNRGNLTATITSPYATTSRLFNSTKDLAADKQDAASVTNFNWTFLTNAFWGEDPLGGTANTSGKWTITMGDVVDDDVATWNSYKVTFLMGNIVISGSGTTTQTENIKARSISLLNADVTLVNPAGLDMEVSEKVEVSAGELNVNGSVKLARSTDDEDPEDGFLRS